jgi:hypothetical protein
MVDPCHMIDVRNPGCRRTAVIFALRVGRTSDLTGLPKTLNGRGGNMSICHAGSYCSRSRVNRAASWLDTCSVVVVFEISQ